MRSLESAYSFLEREYRKAWSGTEAAKPKFDPANFGIALGALELAPPIATISEVAPHILAAEPQDMALWPTLFKTFPDWHWGIQPTGDCCRWGEQHILDVLLSVLEHNQKIAHPDRQVAGESIYALAKHELYDEYGYDGDGSTGWAVCTAAMKFGMLLRRLYEAGGKTYDLRHDHWPGGDHENYWSYIWGDLDRGREGLPKALEAIAAEHKAVDRVKVTTPEQAGKLIQAGYPSLYCGYTYWAYQRGSDGIGTRFSAGSHCMAATGVLWDSGGLVKALWIGNTGHGAHVAGSVGPIPVPAVYAACGGWVPRRLLTSVYGAGDCFAHTMVEGWPLMDLVDWHTEQYL